MAKLNLEIFVLVQAAPPPAQPPAATAPVAQQPQPQLVRLAPISQKSKSLLLTKGGRTENAVVRQQIFLRTTAKPGAVPALPEGVTVSAIPCAWTVDAYLQRDICFFSITNILGCTDPVTKPLMATEMGQADLPVGTACEVFAKPILDAEDRVIASIERIRVDALDEDYKLIVKPQLTGSGATVTER